MRAVGHVDGPASCLVLLCGLLIDQVATSHLHPLHVSLVDFAAGEIQQTTVLSSR